MVPETGRPEWMPDALLHYEVGVEYGACAVQREPIPTGIGNGRWYRLDYAHGPVALRMKATIMLGGFSTTREEEMPILPHDPWPPVVDALVGDKVWTDEQAMRYVLSRLFPEMYQAN